VVQGCGIGCYLSFKIVTQPFTAVFHLLKNQTMKRIFFVAVTLLMFLSCQKNEILDSDIPEWLTPKLESFEEPGKCYGCAVTRIEYNNQLYYHLYCGIWSCMYCQLYDNHGELVNWDQNQFNDFFKKKKNETVIWQCK